MNPSLFSHLTDTELALVDTSSFNRAEATLYLNEAWKRRLTDPLLYTLKYLEDEEARKSYRDSCPKYLNFPVLKREDLQSKCSMDLLVAPVDSPETLEACYWELASRNFLVCLRKRTNGLTREDLKSRWGLEQ